MSRICRSCTVLAANKKIRVLLICSHKDTFCHFSTLFVCSHQKFSLLFAFMEQTKNNFNGKFPPKIEIGNVQNNRPGSCSIIHKTWSRRRICLMLTSLTGTNLEIGIFPDPSFSFPFGFATWRRRVQPVRLALTFAINKSQEH